MTPIRWLLVGVLALSLVANVLLGISTYIYGTQLHTTQERLNTRTVAYNTATANLRAITQELRAAEGRISTLEAEVATANGIADDYRDRAARAEYFVERAKCPAMVDELVAYGASSNSSVKAAVIAALEKMYAGSVQSSSFSTLWNDSLSATLTALWGGGSTKTILSWDQAGNLKTIYDANTGCVMYTR